MLVEEPGLFSIISPSFITQFDQGMSQNSNNTWHLLHMSVVYLNIFHASLLRQYKENEVYGANFDRPLAELISEEEVYEVETILKHRKWGRRYQYFIKWKGFPITEASWEPEEVFIEVESLLDQYKLWHQLWIGNHMRPSPAPHCTTALRSLTGIFRKSLIILETCMAYSTI